MNITRFKDQPIHRELLEKAVKVLTQDDRVQGLYVSGYPETDEFSDIDLMIMSTEEDRESLERDRLEIAGQVGTIMAECMALVPHTYVVVYEPGVKMDYCFHVPPEKIRPDKQHMDIIYDPDGHLKDVVKKSKTSSFSMDHDQLVNLVKHFHVVIAFTVDKLGRGELWESRDTVEYYRALLVQYEHILAERQQVGYRRFELKMEPEKLTMLEKTIPRGKTREESFRCMDAVFEYFDTYMRHRFIELGVFNEEYAENMVRYYEEEKEKILTTKD